MWLGVRAGLQLLHEFLEGEILVRVGAERRLADAREQLAEARIAGEIACASTSVLTKKPISPSISTRVRPAIGVPTAMSSCPV